MSIGGQSGPATDTRPGRSLARWAGLIAVGSLAAGAVVTGVQATREAEAPATPGHRAPAKLVSFSDADGVDRRTGITATVPTAVVVSTSIPVSGVVALASGSPTRRPVRLQELTAGRWDVIAAERSTRRGAFRFAVAAGAVTGSRTFRVVAPAYDRLAAQRTLARKVKVSPPAPTPTPTSTPTATSTPTSTPTATSTPTSTPTAAPAWDPAEYAAPTDPAAVGAAGDWSWLMSQTARWDPCTTIRWVYDANGAYAGSLDDVTRAIARVAGRTGLHFKYVGTSSYVPYSGTGTFPAGADLAVGWSDEQHVTRLSGGVVGIGGGSMTYVSGRDVAGRMVQGSVLLDLGGALAHGFSASGNPTWGQVMEHEVMHAVGLGHATGSEEVMAPSVSALNHFFGNGDLAGMTRVGATNGCLS